MQTKLLIVLLAGSLTCGCTTTATSNTARTSTEQLLISNAIDQALDKIDFQPFAGHAIYLEEKYVDCVDKNYVIASLRHRLMAAGATVVPAADAAEIVVEARSGGVGTATSDSFIGTPEIVLPGMLTLPEVRMITRTRQEGAAKIGIVAYNNKTKQILGPGGQSLAQSADTLWYAAGVGPFRSGSLKADVARSTTGPGAVSRASIPPYVAFNVPTSSETDERGRIQITGAEQQAQPAPPPSAPVGKDTGTH